MFSFTLSMLQTALGCDVIAWDAELIKISASPCQVFRVVPKTAQGRMPTVIVKVIGPDWPGDFYGSQREVLFYTQMAPHLSICQPRVLYAGVPCEGPESLLVLQDLSTYRFPPPEHAWTLAEAGCMVRAYAQLHHAGARIVAQNGVPDWFYPAYALRIADTDIPALANDIVQTGIWPCALDLQKIYDETCAYTERHIDREQTIIHNDVYPPNAGFSGDLACECVLIDWEMVGSGWAELDLAYMFTQPYHSSAKLDREQVLALYWQERARLGSYVPELSERTKRQHYADALLALWLTNVAHRVASTPFPTGSAPEKYWKSMFNVLYCRLDALCSTHR